MCFGGSHKPVTIERTRAGDSRAVRALDLAGSLLGLIVLAPLLLGLSLLVRLTSPGPALFRSTRVGKEHRAFTLYKFRSMRTGAQADGPVITRAGDDRVTPLGRKLRRLKLDELPQLINVLKGDMSLVGPRPEDPSFVALYSRPQREILGARPGITSPASLKYRAEESLLTGPHWRERYIDEVMPAKIAIDCEYLQRRNVASDLGVIWATVRSLWGRRDDCD